METVRRHAWITGRVQGVWYRQTCADLAVRAGVAGWIRNLPDGRVEAVFEGERPLVDLLTQWCREGPSAARVEGVEVVEEPPQGLARFDVVD